MKQTTEMNLTGYESQMQPRSWTRDYLEQIQLVVRAGLELGVFRFQVQRPNHAASSLQQLLAWQVYFR